MNSEGVHGIERGRAIKPSDPEIARRGFLATSFSIWTFHPFV
jgi:hypothetical protein